MEIIFHEDGSKRISGKLKAWAGKHLREADEIMRRWMQGERRFMKSIPYPPPPPASGYTRTGRLANSWSVRKKGMMEYELVNSRDGAGWVIGTGQARVHAGRWYIAEEVVASRADGLQKAYVKKSEKRLQKAAS